MSQSLNAMVAGKLAQLEAKSLKRSLKDTGRSAGAVAKRNGETRVSFCCNDYLNLSTHPKVVEAARIALDTNGLGSGASRLVTGNDPLNGIVERRLAALKGSEAALLFGSGYLANVGIIPALMGPGDLIMLDELSHSCMYMGSRLSRAEVVTFRHNDAEDCRLKLEDLREDYRHCLILTEGVFSMDGDLAPLPELSALSRQHDGWLMTDDAHGFGVLGDGRGSAAHWRNLGFEVEVPLQMGTLSKSVGAYGGYLCASQDVVEFMVNRARSVIYTTGLPPSLLAGVAAALEIIETDVERCAAPLKKAKLFTQCLGLPEAESTIVPVIVGDEETALNASAKLEAEGYLVTAIRPPTVPAGTARLRLTFSSDHKDEDVQCLAELIGDMDLKIQVKAVA